MIHVDRKSTPRMQTIHSPHTSSDQEVLHQVFQYFMETHLYYQV